MNQQLKPATVILILLFFGSILGLKLWAGSRALSVPHLTHIHGHPDGRLFILLGDELHALAPDGGRPQRLDLHDFGVETMLGDFAFFGNGDLLLRKGPHDPGLLDNLRRSQRLDNPAPQTGVPGSGGLYRCRLETRECEPFERRRLNLTDVFHLAVEPGTDRVVVADTSRHQLLLLSPDGTLLDRADTGLKFPNQVLFHDTRLYVANTNYHELTALELSGRGFGDQRRHIPVDVKEAWKTGQRWPISMLPVDGNWWVINARNGMNDGGIYRFDEEGTYLGRLELPADADPFALARLHGQILVSDFSRDRIYRFEPDGSRTDDLHAGPLDQRLWELADERNHYRSLDTLATWLFGIGLALGFLAAIVQIKRSPDPGATPDAEALSVNPRDPMIHWIEPDPQAVRPFRILFYMMLAMLPVLAALVLMNDTMLPALPAMAGAISAATAVFFVLYRVMAGSRIGVLREFLILQNWRGRQAVGRGKNIGYSDIHLVIGDLIIFTSMQNQSLFPKTELMQHVYPLMRQGQYLNRGQMQMLLLKNTPWLTVPLLLMLVAGGILLFLPELPG